MATSRWTASEKGIGSSSSGRLGPAAARPRRRALAVWTAGGLTLASVLVLAGAPGVAGASHAKVVKVGTANVSHVGVVLTTGTGLTLYYFTANPQGKSVCTGACASVWPPYLTSKGAHISGPRGVKGLSLVNVGNGHWQVAYDKAVLYRFEGDKKKGQAKGQGVLGKWYVAMKSGIAAAPAGGAAVTVPSPGSTSTSTTHSTTPHSTTTSQAPHAGTTSPPAPQSPPPTMPPAPAPTTTPTTAPPPPPPTTAPPPPTTTTTNAGGGGVGF